MTAAVPALRDVSLDDKYLARSGAIYLSGTQALVRLPMMQRRRDQAAGLDTAGYITGYRGSPIGAYDQALAQARTHLDTHAIRFVPGTNEDLAATALWGTQQLNLFPGARHAGVFGIWYGKGPGVDRSGDAFRHANQAGTSPHGGVLAIAGDDHAAKSSTVAAQTDHVFQGVSMPVLAPAVLQDYLDLGLHGFALSRFAGLWVALKSVTDTLETAGVVDAADDRVVPILPEGVEWPPGGLHVRWPEEPFLKLEERLTRYKIPAALAYARANRLDRNRLGRPDGTPCRLGIVATGKAYLDLRQALADLGIDDTVARRLGIRVWQVAMPWPLEPAGIRAFCAGCAEILVVEEKRPLVEDQLKALLFADAERPRVVGKTDERGAPLLPAYGELSPALVARVIAARIGGFAEAVDDDRGSADEAAGYRVAARIAALDAAARRPATLAASVERIPYFCSGCPHNTSTRVPEGSRALAGIGCHYMAQWMDRETATFTHMGGEGMAWVGQAPFSETPHVFQNLGDGTYFHSGSLAIRHAVATKTPITYKILFNDAVAMTGGQRHDGALTPQAIARQVHAEGVERIVVVTDEPGKYAPGSFAADVAVHGRETLDAVQRDLREYRGVSVLIYDQTCAAEKRRRRKRGTFPDPARRVVINEAVCEGCGDCGVQSNCVSVEPLETALGRKRTINQSSCNKDFSCVNGFCPSFVSVVGGALRRPDTGAAAVDATGTPRDADETAAFDLPEPARPDTSPTWSLLVTGIGGTGVVTIGQLLGMAAHLEGRAATVLDMAGLAQKNGAVTSFVRFAADVAELHAPRIGELGADAVIGGDLVVTAGRDVLMRCRPGTTRIVCNTTLAPTADFTRNPDLRLPADALQATIRAAVADEAAWFVDATRIATRLLGDAIAGNLFLLGCAYQRGLVPVSATAIEQAIRLNGVAVAMNRNAFRWGRRAAVDPDAVAARAAPATVAVPILMAPRRAETLDDTVATRVEFLTRYQNARYATRYRTLVATVRERSGAPALAMAVARNYFKLLAIKDEYEVARLHADPAFRARLAAQFSGDWSLRFHLAPPLFARRDAQGRLVKREYGPWMMQAFRLLAALRPLRGTPLDPFGRTEERRTERALIRDYETTIGRLLDGLAGEHATPEHLALAVEIASIPDGIRGFGHVKERHLAAARERERSLLARFEQAAQAVAQAA